MCLVGVYSAIAHETTCATCSVNWLRMRVQATVDTRNLYLLLLRRSDVAPFSLGLLRGLLFALCSMLLAHCLKFVCLLSVFGVADL